jgi:predicted component of type VI protein secretion system
VVVGVVKFFFYFVLVLELAPKKSASISKSNAKKCNRRTRISFGPTQKARLNHNTQINASPLRFCLPRLLNPGSCRRKKYEKIRNKTSDV